MGMNKVVDFIRKIRRFYVLFCDQVGIHGFGYLSKVGLTLLEKIFWLILIGGALYLCIDIGLESLDRYNTKSTVVSIEKNHYYWNTSLPSLTICPMERISKTKFNEYCSERNIQGQDKVEFFEFIESLANSSYLNFENIKIYPSVERMNINPKNYMRIIYDLTDDLTRSPKEDLRVRTLNNLEFIRAQQVITEYGICYMTNNFLQDHLSASLLITGVAPAENIYERQREVVLHRVRFGNLFDGDITYSFIGFNTAISMFLHSPYETIDIGRNLGYAVDAYEFEAYSMEIVADDDFAHTTISQRGCRFSHESNLTHFQIYTKGICIQECRINLAYEKCNCIPHFYPNLIKKAKRVCSYMTLKSCFPKYKELFLELRVQETHKPVKCDCLQNCEESKVVVEQIQLMGESKELLGSIGGLVVVKQYPVIRFRRQILFTFTDLLVSIGGTAGFFLGFSVLGAIEIIYFFTLRLFWYVKGRK